jgi:hypothetical protein
MVMHIGTRVAKCLLERRDARLQHDNIAFDGRVIVGNPVVQRRDVLLQCAQDEPKLLELIDRLGAVLPDNGVAAASHQGPHIETEPGKHKYDTTWQAGRRRHRYL